MGRPGAGRLLAQGPRSAAERKRFEPAVRQSGCGPQSPRDAVEGQQLERADVALLRIRDAVVEQMQEPSGLGRLTRRTVAAHHEPPDLRIDFHRLPPIPRAAGIGSRTVRPANVMEQIEKHEQARGLNETPHGRRQPR